MLLVCDGSHWQNPVDFDALKRAGVLGFSHKAFDIKAAPMRDVKYAERKKQALATGLLWGAFCFEENADGAIQADDFIEAAGIDGQTALHLDLEAWATLAEAEAFVTEIHAKTGVYPVVYTRAEYVRYIGGTTSAILGACQLWQADPNSKLAPEPCPPWKSVFLWQRISSVINGVNFDHDYFNGTVDQLKEAWKVATPMITGLKDIQLVDYASVPAFKSPGGELHSWNKVGATVTVDTSLTQAVDGVTYIQTPDDRWFRAEAVGSPTPPPIPDPVPPTIPGVPMWVTGTGGTVLRVRIAPSTTAAIVRLQDGTYVQLPDGTPVQAIGTGSAVSPFFIQISVVWHGVVVVGYASKTYLSVTPPKS